MAGIIAVGISMGAEKLGRKISEKRLERKDKKAATVSQVP
jgi:predicted alpha/beta-fold hydrolase